MGLQWFNVHKPEQYWWETAQKAFIKMASTIILEGTDGLICKNNYYIFSIKLFASSRCKTNSEIEPLYWLQCRLIERGRKNIKNDIHKWKLMISDPRAIFFLSITRQMVLRPCFVLPSLILRPIILHRGLNTSNNPSWNCHKFSWVRTQPLKPHSIIIP